MQRPLFRDRAIAGRQLAQRLTSLAGNPEVIVLGLPRGGVPVAYEVAAALRAPLDVFVVRKLGVPGHEEYAMGAIATGGVRVLNPEVISRLDISPLAVERVTVREREKLERRSRDYRVGGPAPVIRGATVVLVDDGIATGATMQAAVAAVRQLGAGAVVVAAPVMSQDALRTLSSIADRCECVVAPEPFGSVGAYYVDFSQTSVAEVRRLLSLRRNGGVPAAATRAEAIDMRIPARGVELHGDLIVPTDAKGIVVFAHGSGSSRRSPRNQQVAAALSERGFATLLFDLLTESEEQVDRMTGELRFNVSLLASRLVHATDWLRNRPDTRALALGYFGASTGAAAALIAAAERPEVVRAVVSRGGRPDLAGEALPRVHAPTLLIVGGNDFQVLSLNRTARRYMHAAETEVVVVPNATHLFEEPGTLEEVARLAGEWFEAHLAMEPAAMAAG